LKEKKLSFKETIGFVEANCQLFAEKYKLFVKNSAFFAEKFDYGGCSCEQ